MTTMMMHRIYCIILILNITFYATSSTTISSSSSSILNIENYGAIPTLNNIDAARNNTNAINKALNESKPGDTILIPAGNEYFAIGGISGYGLKNITISIQGQIRALPDIKHWPLQQHKMNNNNNNLKSIIGKHDQHGYYLHFFHFVDCKYLTITGSATYPSKADGSGVSLIDGNGLVWWNKYVISTNYAKRPKLVVFESSENILIENITMLNSPSFHLLMHDILNVEIRYVTINVDRSVKEARKYLKEINNGVVAAAAKVGGLQPEDLNTDGIDPSGKNVYVHHVFINNDDDSIAVKPCSKDKCSKASCSENMLFEDMIVIGMGLSIGSVPPHKMYPYCVRNITFRRISMPKTGKGVYIKSNPTCVPNSTAIIENILYEDINITYPRWWAVWIGPQQQHEPGTKLGRKCPLDYPITKTCPTQGCVKFNNITLRNIYIDSPVLSPGVVLGNESNPMTNVVFDNVVVKGSGKWPFDHTYQCKHANVQSIGGTKPVVNCG